MRTQPYIILVRVLFHAFQDNAFSYATYLRRKAQLACTQYPLFPETVKDAGSEARPSRTLQEVK